MGSAKDKFDTKGREKIRCLICGLFYHRLDTHLQTKHSMSVDDYHEKFPKAPVLSETAQEMSSKSSKKKIKVKTKKEEDKNEGNKNEYHIGVATLKHRNDLTLLDREYVDKNTHDEGWIIDNTVLQMLEDIAVGIEDEQPVFIGGPTGCGKSQAVKELAAIIDQPLCRVQLTRDFRASQFVGRTELRIDKDGNQYTEFVYGVLPKAIKNGWWLLLDEIDQAHPDVLMAIQAVLEGEPLVLSENFGEVVSPGETERSKNFRIIATANTFGKGDDSGLYVGAKIMNEATLDRFGVTIKADYPVYDTEVEILVKKAGIKKPVAKKMVSIGQKVREAVLNDVCTCTFSTRRLIMWAKKYKRYNDVRRSINVSVLNKIQEQEDVRFISDLVQRYFGGDVS